MNRLHASQIKVLFDEGLLRVSEIAKKAGIATRQTSALILTATLKASLLDFAHALESCSDDASATKTIQQYAPLLPLFLIAAEQEGNQLAKESAVFEVVLAIEKYPYFCLGSFTAFYIEHLSNAYSRLHLLHPL